MKKILFLLSGPCASGKSSYAKRVLVKYNLGEAIWHSRDMIRFALLQEGEDYFCHEKEVFELWIKAIQNSIDDPNIKVIIADATHLTQKSRNKTLWHLNLKPDVEVINVVFDVPLEECLKRNNCRTGRERVSEKVIKDMFERFEMPNDKYRTTLVDSFGDERM